MGTAVYASEFRVGEEVRVATHESEGYQATFDLRGLGGEKATITKVYFGVYNIKIAGRRKEYTRIAGESLVKAKYSKADFLLYNGKPVSVVNIKKGTPVKYAIKMKNQTLVVEENDLQPLLTADQFTAKGLGLLEGESLQLRRRLQGF